MYEPVAPFEVTTAASTESADAEAHLLPFHVAAGHAEIGQARRDVLLGQVAHHQAGHEQHDHDRQQQPAGARPADHVAEGDRQGRGQHRDGQQAEEVGQRRRVRVGMGAVGVEEAAAVGAQVLDELQGGDGPLGDRLRPPLQRLRLDIRRPG